MIEKERVFEIFWGEPGSNWQANDRWACSLRILRVIFDTSYCLFWVPSIFDACIPKWNHEIEGLMISTLIARLAILALLTTALLGFLSVRLIQTDHSGSPNSLNHVLSKGWKLGLAHDRWVSPNAPQSSPELLDRRQQVIAQKFFPCTNWFADLFRGGVWNPFVLRSQTQIQSRTFRIVLVSFCTKDWSSTNQCDDCYQLIEHPWLCCRKCTELAFNDFYQMTN